MVSSEYGSFLPRVIRLADFQKQLIIQSPRSRPMSLPSFLSYMPLCWSQKLTSHRPIALALRDHLTDRHRISRLTRPHS